MSKRIVGIAGSPRRGGNSETFLDAAIEGAVEAGASVEKLVLNEADVDPCQNCGFCSRQKTCRLDDGMSTIYRALDDSNAIIIAAPIYFGSLNAQTKMMIDRCQPYWARKFLFNESRAELGQECVFLSCCGFRARRAEDFFANADAIIDVWCAILDIHCRTKLHFRGVDARGDAAKDAAALSKVRDAGRELASSTK